MNPKLISLLESGYAAQQRGELATAAKLYDSVLAKDRNNEFALNLMGLLRYREKRFQDAADFLERAVKVNAQDAETQNNLGLTYKNLHRFQDAERAFSRSLEINPAQPQTLNNRGNVLAAINRHRDAVESFEAALGLAPAFSDCLYNLAVSLKELRQADKARIAIEHALRLEPRRSEYHNTLAEIELTEARYEKARQHIDTAIRLGENFQSRLNLSTILKQTGDPVGAQRCLESILDEYPEHADAHHHLGILLEQLGDNSGAAEAHRAALRCNPRLASSYYQIAKMKGTHLTDEEIESVHRMLNDDSLLDIFRSSLCFALACESERLKDYPEAMQWYLKAQALKASREPYSPEIAADYVNASRAVFPVATRPLPNSHSPVPVFVLGMPRSGTTLTEQILSSHSEIGGAGEVAFIKDLAVRASAVTGQPFPICARTMSEGLIAELRAEYFQRMETRCGESRYVVDKNPLNFNFLGFIASLFPEAKIFYCRRDPIDNCVSIFRLPFDDNQGYSHDLSALGHYYQQHRLLMKVWQEYYPGQILTVQYEDTVDDVERQARRMLAFLGADFESAVLNFFDNDRAVLTPSTAQVRQPIYRSSVNAWQRYGSALDPLLESLRKNGAIQI